MSNLTLNKAAAAILVAGLIGMVTGKVTEFLYEGGPEHPGHHEEAVRGYKIDVVETADSGGAEAPRTAGDLSALYATADVKAGEDYVAKKCTVCHDVSKGGANKVGPHLWGVVNRQIASIGDFSYSSGMKAHAGTAKTWSVDNLNAFLWSPQRANVIAYIATQMTDSPAKLPTAAAKPAADKGGDKAKAAPKK